MLAIAGSSGSGPSASGSARQGGVKDRATDVLTARANRGYHAQNNNNNADMTGSSRGSGISNPQVKDPRFTSSQGGIYLFIT